MEIDGNWLSGITASASVIVGGGIKQLWAYFQKKDEEKTARYKEILDGKDKMILGLQVQIQEMGKDLSRKSDDHAKKIEELMTLTLNKLQELATKNEAREDAKDQRLVKVLEEFRDELRAIRMNGSTDAPRR